MTSKILVKLPTVPFVQAKKPHTELVAVANRNDMIIPPKQSNNSGDRAIQLEQNMKFLQEQHQAILVALQKEVEILRQRNRDLQFQLVFSNSPTNAPASPSSPEDSGNAVFLKSKGSPVSVNVASLQVELLERDLQDLKVSLQEAKSQNHYLVGIIDQQRKKLDTLECRSEKPCNTEVGIQVGSDIQAGQADFSTRLEDAEAMVLCLRRENEDQRREISAMKSTANKGNGNNTSGRPHGNHGHRSRGQGHGGGGQEQNSHRFPPLHNHSYWHHGFGRDDSFDHYSEYRGRARHDKQGHDSGNGGGTVLPQLRSGTNKSDSFSYPSFHVRSRGYHNDSSYYGDGYRKHRGQRSQRDCKDRESREPRESREQHRDLREQKEYKDTSRGQKDPKTSKEK
ncbi:coiled-coil domain-containing protein 74A-like isoform X1 [Athalia rosae]|uniref:coiled-coil domain-containing protein 74A-like isoform X1 n=1 Tax=Athalia rosae TaxID=37344 RepID=UPI00203466A2|nr:coiled-coil domain-containing protein 74A-like isoform X1 [Athalia rosae]